MHHARTRAQELSAPFSLAFAHFGSALLHLFRREIQDVHEHTERLMALTTEHGFVHWATLGMFLRGWVLAAQGQQEAGITQMCQGIAANHATGVELIWPYFLALVAEAYTKAGQRETGLPVLTDALALMDRHAERFWEAELHRLQGELLQQAVRGTWNAALTPEECFCQALAIARRQQAKSWELRAATSLARLWQRQGKRAVARELLADLGDSPGENRCEV